MVEYSKIHYFTPIDPQLGLRAAALLWKTGEMCVLIVQRNVWNNSVVT